MKGRRRRREVRGRGAGRGGSRSPLSDPLRYLSGGLGYLGRRGFGAGGRWGRWGSREWCQEEEAAIRGRFYCVAAGLGRRGSPAFCCL